MSRPVPDEVWQRLDPRAGALSQRTMARLRRALAAAVLLFAVGVAIWHSGLVVPHVAWPREGGYGFELDRSGVARLHVAVTNAGWFPVTVLGVGRSEPGFELLRIDGGGAAEDARPSPFPMTLRPGQRVEVALTYRLSDCDSLPRGDWPLTARVERPWGVMTVDVRDETVSGRRWQEQVVDLWCDPQAWSID